MERNIKFRHQQGFLIVILVTIIVILAFVGVILAYMFSINTTSSTNTYQADNALYIAISGLEKAKRDITINGINCDNTAQGLAPNYTNVSLFNGQYTVTGTTKSANTTLNGAITAQATSITLASTSSLSSPIGIIFVDSEYIYYPKFSGNTLQNVTRGALGSTAATHANGAAVAQNQCLLNSTAGAPTIASPEGKRIIQAILPGGLFSISGVLSSTAIPTVTSLGSVNLSGNILVENPYATMNGTSYSGANILSSGGVVFNGTTTTEVTSSSGSGLVTSSTTSPYNILPDVQGSATYPNSLWSYYFSFSSSNIGPSAGLTYSDNTTLSSSPTTTSGEIVWVAGSLTIAGNVTLGSPTAPVILIVGDNNGNGNINQTSGTFTIYGLLYGKQGISLTNAYIYGGMAAQGAININTGPAIIQYNAPILSTLGILGKLVTHYTSSSCNQEIFQ